MISIVSKYKGMKYIKCNDEKQLGLKLINFSLKHDYSFY